MTSPIAMALGVTAVYPEWQKEAKFNDLRTIFEEEVYEIRHGFDWEVRLRRCVYQPGSTLHTHFRTIAMASVHTPEELKATIEDFKARLPEFTLLEVL